MAISAKYGKVALEHGTVEVGEPVFIFRARDKLLPEVLAFYSMLCMKAGSPMGHLQDLAAAHDGLKTWQENHMIKTPD